MSIAVSESFRPGPAFVYRPSYTLIRIAGKSLIVRCHRNRIQKFEKRYWANNIVCFVDTRPRTLLFKVPVSTGSCFTNGFLSFPVDGCPGGKRSQIVWLIKT